MMPGVSRKPFSIHDNQHTPAGIARKCVPSHFWRGKPCCRSLLSSSSTIWRSRRLSSRRCCFWQIVVRLAKTPSDEKLNRSPDVLTVKSRLDPTDSWCVETDENE